ncbi:MAG: hypothetical protein ACOX4G_07590 [Limnochordia bacterium]
MPLVVCGALGIVLASVCLILLRGVRAAAQGLADAQIKLTNMLASSLKQ